MLKLLKFQQVFIQKCCVHEKKQFLKAEDLIQKWRSLIHPTEACGSRSYALLG